MSEKQEVLNALTIDVEDYFHVSAFAETISPSDWNSMECRVEKNIDVLLEMFNNHSLKATFFVLGWVAERYSDVVKKIDAEGHEIASHGYSHQLIYNQSRELFREETLKSKVILEDLIQKEVIGYRAASYSITDQSLWALDILCDAGFKYDSSIFPVHHDRYGLKGVKEEPHLLKAQNGKGIVEFPLSVYKIMDFNIPIAGGGYFRLFPYWFTRYAFNRINKGGNPFIFYLHPWEVDPGQPKVQSSRFSMFRHYNNLAKCENRLEKLLTDFRFGTVMDVLAKNGFSNFFN